MLPAMLTLNMGDHALDRCAERAGRDAAWLLQTINQINNHLPDDWRMTRASNNFRVLVRDAGISIVGRSFRVGQGETLHITDTVLMDSHFDQVGIPDDVTRVTQRVRMQHGLMAPNLYLLRPTPDGFASPLFARQYEKVRMRHDGKPTGDEYHRLHPLTRDGLDPMHWLWVRFTVQGDVEFVDHPGSDYHGRDYWDTPELTREAGRGKAADYRRRYDQQLRLHGVSESAPPSLPDDPYVPELKLIIAAGRAGTAGVVGQIKQAVRDLGWTVGREAPLAAHSDYYFDDQRRTLYRRGASLRLRSAPAVSRVTLKVQPSDPEPGSGYRRVREDAVPSAAQAVAMLNGQMPGIWPVRLVDYVAPGHGPLSRAEQLDTQRRHWTVLDDTRQEISIRADICRYLGLSGATGEFAEIEIEVSQGDAGHLAAVASLLAEHIAGLVQSSRSKYQVAVEMMGEHVGSA
jgi:hypothetical protein